MKVFAALLLTMLWDSTGVQSIRPLVSTDSVDTDADDPAIWINQSNPEKSLILGTCKGGGLYAFDLSGKLLQVVRGLKHPNNVDVEYGFEVAGKPVDIAVMTEREAGALRIFAVDASGMRDISGLTGVFAGESGERAAPMGIALYKSPKDGAIYAFVSRKDGPSEGYIWQYRLSADANGKVNLTKVRELGHGISGRAREPGGGR